MNDTKASMRESEIIQSAIPYIKNLCKKKWTNMEPEDRVAEATYYFLCAIRSIPTNTGCFIQDFEKELIPYMDQINSTYPPRFYSKMCSLDSLTPTNNGSSQWTLYDSRAGSFLDQSALCVKLFFKSLPPEHRKILYALLMEGLPKSAIARQNGLTVYELKKILHRIAENYLQDRWS